MCVRWQGEVINAINWVEWQIAEWFYFDFYLKRKNVVKCFYLVFEVIQSVAEVLKWIEALIDALFEFIIKTFIFLSFQLL